MFGAREGSPEDWNSWRLKYGKIKPDFSEVNLEDADLSDLDLRGANFLRARLSGASFARSDLAGANFSGAEVVGGVFTETNLDQADLSEGSFNYSDFRKAKLTNVSMNFSTFVSANFKDADLTCAYFWETTLSDADLSGAIGLDTSSHEGPSSVDLRMLSQSGPLPLKFLRGVGLPDVLIDYLPSLLNRPIQYYSCFISYSTKDQIFAERLHADLQNHSIRCWFAPHDMPIGGKIWDEIDSAIRLRDKVLLILSEHSIKSDWVEDEVTKALEEERMRDRIILFPVRLDDAVLDTKEAWAAKLRARHIGDFTRWKEHDEYQKSFERVLRDLTVKKDQ